jgi:hypothetical protein
MTGTSRVSDVAPSLDDEAPEEKSVEVAVQPRGPDSCKFCPKSSSYMRRDRLGTVHIACTEHDPELEQWILEENGWKVENVEGAGETTG